MTQGKRVGLSATQKSDIWCRWKARHSLHEIGRAFGKEHASIHFLLSHHGGIVPATRRRSLLALTLAEREDISRGIACGSSIRWQAPGCCGRRRQMDKLPHHQAQLPAKLDRV
jgi:hypothetical protein